MKLPIAKLNKVKLQSLKSLRKIARQLSSMERERSERTRNLTRLKQGKERGKSAYRVALTLLLVRPWVLVMGFWIFSMGIGTLALGGMLSPKRLTMALPEPAADTSTASPTQGSSAQGSSTQSSDTLIMTESAELSDIASAESTDSNSAEPARTNATNSSGLALALPMVLLVSACAVGCFAISRRRAMRMAAARARVRKARSGLTVVRANSQAGNRTGATQASSKASGLATPTRPINKANHKIAGHKTPVRKLARTASASQRAPKIFPVAANASTAELRPKKRRQRSKAVLSARIAAKSATHGRKGLASRATAVRPNGQSRPTTTRTKKGTIRAASRRRHPAGQPSIVSVVPASESHALDWKERSLAHQMDIRSHRSAM